MAYNYNTKRPKEPAKKYLTCKHLYIWLLVCSLIYVFARIFLEYYILYDAISNNYSLIPDFYSMTDFENGLLGSLYKFCIYIGRTALPIGVLLSVIQARKEKPFYIIKYALYAIIGEFIFDYALGRPMDFSSMSIAIPMFLGVIVARLYDFIKSGYLRGILLISYLLISFILDMPIGYIIALFYITYIFFYPNQLAYSIYGGVVSILQTTMVLGYVGIYFTDLNIDQKFKIDLVIILLMIVTLGLTIISKALFA